MNTAEYNALAAKLDYLTGEIAEIKKAAYGANFGPRVSAKQAAEILGVSSTHFRRLEKIHTIKDPEAVGHRKYFTELIIELRNKI